MMRFLLGSAILTLLFILSNATVRQRALKVGEGINFPQRPLTRTVAEKYVFNRDLYALYRLANPLFPPGVSLDVDLKFDPDSQGDLNTTVMHTIGGVCQTLNFVFQVIHEEGNRALYTWDGPFPTTGKGVTNSFFSCWPEDYVFMFSCLDRAKEHVRNGRRVYCDGPFDIMFAVYDYPPDRVRWCAAEKCLWRNLGLTFNNEFMTFLRTGERCPRV